ncbi:Formin-binding protein 1 [Fasciola hepatica]|uniref:Formin-binding protein 1 n=1 Tax=Fasciola hepatica TaxID=6192 RepID=A0A4E0QUV2_FASHE|nr:Formin-binding protein 1 [Fasciola hepatica]
MVQITDWIVLWDKASSLIKYQEAGITLHERLQKFLAEFSKLQNDAFTAQKKLCEKYVVDVEKLFGSENSYGTMLNTFVQLVQRIVDTECLISGAFEIQAGGDLKQAIEDEKRRYKRWKHDRDKLSSEMKSQIRIMDDEKKRYRDKFREMLKANEEYAKIEADKSHSYLDVEKVSL